MTDWMSQLDVDFVMEGDPHVATILDEASAWMAAQGVTECAASIITVEGETGWPYVRFVGPLREIQTLALAYMPQDPSAALEAIEDFEG
jgi:hypothetical protein